MITFSLFSLLSVLKIDIIIFFHLFCQRCRRLSYSMASSFSYLVICLKIDIFRMLTFILRHYREITIGMWFCFFECELIFVKSLLYFCANMSVCWFEILCKYNVNLLYLFFIWYEFNIKNRFCLYSSNSKRSILMRDVYVQNSVIQINMLIIQEFLL